MYKSTECIVLFSATNLQGQFACQTDSQCNIWAILQSQPDPLIKGPNPTIIQTQPFSNPNHSPNPNTLQTQPFSKPNQSPNPTIFQTQPFSKPNHSPNPAILQTQPFYLLHFQQYPTDTVQQSERIGGFGR